MIQSGPIFILWNTFEVVYLINKHCLRGNGEVDCVLACYPAGPGSIPARRLNLCASFADEKIPTPPPPMADWNGTNKIL